MSTHTGVGIFDSGVGGLTVARGIRRLLPKETILYFGDSIHLPYGNKSERMIVEYSLANARFLIERGVKLLVVACNTSSSVALPTLKSRLDIPVIDVVEPGSREAARVTRSGSIGVIGTYRTIHSNAYRKMLFSLNKKLKITQKACPLLVPLLESGFPNRQIIREIIREYMEPMSRTIDTLILGCTHYPLLKAKIREVFPHLSLIDSALATARAVQSALTEFRLHRTKGKASLDIYTNDMNEVFFKMCRRLFPGSRAKYISDLEEVCL